MADWVITNDVSGWYAWGPDGQIRKIDVGWPDITRIHQTCGEAAVSWGVGHLGLALYDQFLARFGDPHAAKG